MMFLDESMTGVSEMLKLVALQFENVTDSFCMAKAFQLPQVVSVAGTRYRRR
jgi:hypothetical protein